MGIYIDANRLWSWRTFTESDRLAVTIVARQLGQEIFVAAVAAREGEEHFRRSLDDALEEVDRAHATVERLFDMEVDLDLEPWPDVDSSVATWRRRLAEMATILPLHDADAHAALDREITGTPPTKPRQQSKPGRGARDAAIWLTIRRHHAARGEEGHFLSKDGDFSDGHGRLHPRLRAELEADGSPEIHLYPSVGAFVARLGTTVAGREITLGELRDSAGAALTEGLKNSPVVPLALWEDLRPSLRYRTKITALEPTEILDQLRYEQGGDAVVVVNARWNLTTDSGYQDRETTTPELWNVLPNIEVTATVQVFLEERGGEPRGAQFIGAQAKSDTYLFFNSDDLVGSMTTLRRDESER